MALGQDIPQERKAKKCLESFLASADSRENTTAAAAKQHHQKHSKSNSSGRSGEGDESHGERNSQRSGGRDEEEKHSNDHHSHSNSQGSAGSEDRRKNRLQKTPSSDSNRGQNHQTSASGRGLGLRKRPSSRALGRLQKAPSSRGLGLSGSENDGDIHTHRRRRHSHQKEDKESHDARHDHHRHEKMGRDSQQDSDAPSHHPSNRSRERRLPNRTMSNEEFGVASRNSGGHRQRTLPVRTKSCDGASGQLSRLQRRNPSLLERSVSVRRINSRDQRGGRNSLMAKAKSERRFLTATKLEEDEELPKPSQLFADKTPKDTKENRRRLLKASGSIRRRKRSDQHQLNSNIMAQNLPDEDWMENSFEDDPFDPADNEGYLGDASKNMDDSSKRRVEPKLSRMSISDLKSRLLAPEPDSDGEEDEDDFEHIEDQYRQKHGVPPPLPAVLAD